METLVKKLVKESQIEVVKNVGHFQGIESEIHYKMMNPIIKNVLNPATPELVEESRKESVVSFEVVAQGVKLSVEEMSLLKSAENEFNTTHAIILERKEEVKAISPAKVVTAKPRVTAPATGTPAHASSKTEKPAKNVVITKDKVLFREGDKIVSELENTNKLKVGEFPQFSNVSFKLKDKQVKGQVKSILWNDKAKKLFLYVDNGTGKNVQIAENTILDYAIVANAKK